MGLRSSALRQKHDDSFSERDNETKELNKIRGISLLAEKLELFHGLCTMNLFIYFIFN
jgi:hypothetical protein